MASILVRGAFRRNADKLCCSRIRYYKSIKGCFGYLPPAVRKREESPLNGKLGNLVGQVGKDHKP